MYPPIQLIGAGIAGLTLANLLHQRNISFELYERLPSIDERGHGFIIPSEGMDLLAQIIDIDQLRQQGTLLDAYQSLDHKGNKLANMSASGNFAISRGNLIRSLCAALPSSNLHLNKQLQSLEMQADHITRLIFNDGTAVDATLIVASDGINSLVRRIMFPQSRLVSVRQNEIVCMVDNKQLAEELGGTLFKYHHQDGGRAIGMVRLSENNILWYAQFDANQYSVDTTYELKPFTLQHFGHWNAHIDKVLSLSDFNKAHLWRIQQLEQLPAYHKYNVILAGDAAHPLLPFTSQGVTSAQKDAHLLYDLFSQHTPDELLLQLAQYSTLRMKQMQVHFDNGNQMLANFLLPLYQQGCINLPLSK